MARLHPYQHSYFNILAGKNLEGKWEIDTWSLSYTNALRALAKQDNRPKIRIAYGQSACTFATYLLPESQRKRFIMVENLAEADYYLTTYAAVPNRQEHIQSLGLQEADKVLEIRVGKQELLAAFRVK